MNSTPYFSIIIPTYNSFKKLLRALESLQNQTFQNFEVIIIDDGSTDETSQKIAEVLSPRFFYFYKTNGGPASARNFGIQKATGKYLCFLDADDEFLPNKLSVFYQACEQNHLFLFSDAEFINETSDESYFFSSRVTVFQHTSFLELLRNNFIVTSTVCIKTSLLFQTNYFDESPEIQFAEDYDLWLKIAYNYPLTYISHSLTKYYIHETNHSKNIQNTIRALKKIYLKWIFTSPIAVKQLLKYSIVGFYHKIGWRF